MSRFFKKIRFLAFLLLVFYSCTENNTIKNNLQNVHVIHPLKTNGSLFFEDSTINYVRIQGSPSISEILDVGIIDSICYILDANGMISAVDISDGTIIKQLNRKGHAVGEMINPKCITTDSNLIFIFDGGKNEIMLYNKDFQYIDRLKISIDPSSIIKIDDGFLCYDRITSTVYHLNKMGEVAHSHVISDKEVNITTRQQVFKVCSDSEIYVRTEYSDTIFVWNNKKLLPKFILNYNKSNTEKAQSVVEMWKEGTAFTYNYFLTERGLISAYMKDKMLNYILYDMEKEQCFAYKSSKTGKLPLIPKWQFGSLIIGIVDQEVFQTFLDMDEEINKTCQWVILKYSL